jgi:HK97 family phage prohead protease
MNEPIYKQFCTRLEVKELDDDDGTIEGYGSVFNVEDIGGDIILPGAFKKSLRAHKKAKTTPKMLWQHDPHQPIGKWTDIAEDEHGLNVRGKMLIESDPLARTAHAHLQEKSIDGLSIGFVIDDYKIRKDNPLARVESVKRRDMIKTVTDFERLLRDAMGLSRLEAKRVAALGYAGLQRDVDSEELGQMFLTLSERLT